MKIIKSSEVDNLDLTQDQKLWVYNGFDNCLTLEIFDVIYPKLNPKNTLSTYNFVRAMQAPALTMMGRGIKVDLKVRDEMINSLRPRLFKLGGMRQDKNGKWQVVDDKATIQVLAKAIWGRGINYNSPMQLKDILYKNLGLPEQKKNDKGTWKVTTDRNALEKLSKQYPRANFFCRVLLKIRDIEKDLQVLHSQLHNGRMYYNLNVVGAETGRWSSRKNVFDLGTNIQNITPELRKCFVPDEGYEMFYADLKTAESVAVGYLSEDEEYIKACKEEDLHTIVARLVWSDLPWTGDIKEDEKYARENIYYRNFSYRDMAKRSGHASNYLGTPKTVADQLKIEQKIVRKFQALYFGDDIMLTDLYRWGFKDLLKSGEIVEVDSAHSIRKYDKILRLKGAFPKIREWHDKTITELQLKGELTTPLKRRRRFWGRLWDKATWREAIADEPQSLIADILCLGLLKVWEDLEPEVQVLMNGHDAILGQIPVGTREKFEKEIVDRMLIDVPINGRIMTIGVSINYGMNWLEACGD